MRLFEIVADAFFENRRRKRTERLPLFYAGVEGVAHFSAARGGDDGTIAESAWSKLHSSLKPTHDQAICDVRGCSPGHITFAMVLECQSALIERLANAITLKLRAGVSAHHRFRASLSEHMVVQVITNAERRSTVTRGGLNKDPLERRVQQNLSVHHRVVSDTAGQAEIRQTSLLVQMIQHNKGDLFQSQLQTRRNVALAIRQHRTRLACRTKCFHKRI